MIYLNFIANFVMVICKSFHFSQYGTSQKIYYQTVDSRQKKNKIYKRIP